MTQLSDLANGRARTFISFYSLEIHNRHWLISWVGRCHAYWLEFSFTCAFSFLGVCPSGLKQGFIRWDDEQSEIDYKDKHFGDLPDGNYEISHTTINYCCSTKGNINNPIQLPALKPFYLLTYDSAQCQKVAGTKVTSEFIKFDDDDQANTDAAGGEHPYGPSEDPFNLKIYYCYYEPGVYIYDKAPSWEVCYLSF